MFRSSTIWIHYGHQLIEHHPLINERSIQSINLLNFTKLKETFHWNSNKSEHVSHSHAMPYSMLSYTMPNVQCPTSKLKELLHLLNRLMKRKTITCTSVIINKILWTVNVLCILCYHRWRFRLPFFFLHLIIDSIRITYSSLFNSLLSYLNWIPMANTFGILYV